MTPSSDAVVVVTEWDEFKNIDLAALNAVMSTPLIADCRNALDRVAVQEAGFAYFGVGFGISGREHLAERAERRASAALAASS